MGYKLTGCDTGGFPFYLFKQLIEEHNIEYFCETGTAGGLSVKKAATIFKKCWTIEILKGVQEKENAPDNIVFMEGNSIKLLPEVVDQLLKLKGTKQHQWAIFYLDAHYSSDVPNTTGNPECPVLREIRTLAEYGNDAIVVIDDARLFFGSPPYPHDPTEWPSICEIFVLLKECFPYHHITITDDYVLAIPLHVRDVIDKEWRDRFDIRYPNDADKLRGQYKDVWKDVKNRYSEFLKYVE